MDLTDALLLGHILNTGDFEDEFTYDEEETCANASALKPSNKTVAWVNVFQEPGEDPKLYFIHVTDKKIKGALENWRCRSADEIDYAITAYRARYRAIGRTFTENRMGDPVQRSVGKVESKLHCPCCGKWVLLHLGKLIEVLPPEEEKPPFRPLEMLAKKEVETVR